MAIQMRRGLKVSFDPQKMLPGEWAVSIDQETENQIIWMCFRAGVVKRMGTYEDFKEQILEITEDIAEAFNATINEIKLYMEGLKDTAEGYKNIAEQKANEASSSADFAKDSEINSRKNAVDSANSADLSEEYFLKSKSYAIGTDGEVRPGDNSDCAGFYYEQTKRIAQGIEGIIPMGTITFEELSLPQNEVPKYMFDISNDFVSDERFKNGSGIYYGAGSNVIRTADDMWDVLTPVSVMGVKGDKEEIYHQGFVNLTAENIGAATKEEVEEIAGSITGVNADFVGTESELQEKLESGEVTEGMTVFLKDENGGETGGNSGGTSADFQEQIERYNTFLSRIVMAEKVMSTETTVDFLNPANGSGTGGYHKLTVNNIYNLFSGEKEGYSDFNDVIPRFFLLSWEIIPLSLYPSGNLGHTGLSINGTVMPGINLCLSGNNFQFQTVSKTGTHPLYEWAKYAFKATFNYTDSALKDYLKNMDIGGFLFRFYLFNTRGTEGEIVGRFKESDFEAPQ